DQVRQFVGSLGRELIYRSFAIDASPNLEEDVWRHADPTVALRWDEFVCGLFGDDSKVDERTVAAPSGYRGAPLSFVWHYPTWKTAKPSYGLTLDATNPCMLWQCRKIRVSQEVLTSDAIPLREKYDPRGFPTEKYENWDEIEEECFDFTRWLHELSR